MRILTRSIVGCLAVAAAFLPQALAQNNQRLLPAGTSLHVRLGTTLTSKTNKTGDKFTGEVDQDVTADGKTIIPKGSTVTGHVAFMKPSGRIHGRAQMRIVLDSLTTPNDAKFPLSGTLQDAENIPCAKTSDNEGTVKGCGKSKKDALKAAGIVGAMGAGAGATIGMGSEIDCQYYGNCGAPGIGTDVGYGAALGAGTALIYNLLKHEKQIVLIEGTDLTFIVNRSVEATHPATAANTNTP